MGLLARIGRPGRAALLLATGLAGGGAALAVASVAGSDGVIHACYEITAGAGGATVPASGPNLRVIDTDAGQACATTAAGRPTELPLDWNVTGPQGPPGTPGTSGAPGAPGAPGATGPAVTIGAGRTLTLPGGHVLTVGGTPGFTLAPLPIRTAGSPLANVTLTAGRQKLTFGILAVSFAGATTRGRAAKVAVHDVTITKHVDRSSPKLLLAVANGQHFGTAVVTLRKSKKSQPFLQYTMTNAVVSAAQESNGGGGDKPVESLTLNFTKVTIKS